ncbi:MAG: hypothetical protein Ct9H300mP1_04820 [Planctomycetaceae bacterium]|nr:MAG: hypothetical protein Ct9H300mP1_04820 [Planctomycetaceae bacterium]
MPELTYLDRVGLVAWDVPPGWQMVLDERRAHRVAGSDRSSGHFPGQPGIRSGSPMNGPGN